MKRSSRVVPGLVAIILAVAGQASADIAFTTFGPGDAYGTSPYTVGAAFGSPYAQCAAFTITGSQSYQLDSIEAALSHAFNLSGIPIGVNEVGLRLMDAPDGTVIEEFVFTGQMQPYGAGLASLVGSSVLHPVLDPGVEYWLVAYTPTYGTLALWSDSDPAVYGRTLTLGPGLPQPIRTDRSLPAFRINGTPVVPVPGAVLLGLLGLGTAGGFLRRRA